MREQAGLYRLPYPAAAALAFAGVRKRVHRRGQGMRKTN
ncbi:hypothetical protein CBM2586_A50304 [Cupriavidus phytorum]|uniref:Uncharacterized protein n=2 Tax=Cupriavidus TaxID=106589 RepID=A0A375C340_9BURK|nr:hypothetical protein CBM2588_A120231 [Cupriavidus taiwanensis]SOZ35231.1 hypothetical protein CBM2605_A170150 [Cupriavidus neocaledonicus]SOY62059.1 hypothetical protein CBM2586_A50304 [Cupriavidus taiwanensis]SOY81728.1 hypothetical protein CBM2600_A120346 [Cupriavidus taiwanensis]SOZ22063.1 hypothetical protein CBM2608_A160225 [Cupriavidus taiwanensis]